MILVPNAHQMSISKEIISISGPFLVRFANFRCVLQEINLYALQSRESHFEEAEFQVCDQITNFTGF